MTAGTKIVGKFYDSKSWLYNNEIYSEDTGKVTKQNIGNQGWVEFRNCLPNTVFSIHSGFINSEVLPIYSFVSSNPKTSLGHIQMINSGFSYPNVRKVFNNSVVGTPVTVRTENLNNEGGGTNFDYGDGIVILGDRFSKPHLNSYVMYRMVNNLTIEPNTTSNATFTGRAQGNLDILVDLLDSTKLTVPETGLYEIGVSFVAAGTLTDLGLSIKISSSTLNAIGQHYDNKASGELNTFTNMLFLNKGDKLTISFKNIFSKTKQLFLLIVAFIPVLQTLWMGQLSILITVIFSIPRF
jgi:hypothetical protein